jgi:hypothetical protein
MNYWKKGEKIEVWDKIIKYLLGESHISSKYNVYSLKAKY